MLIEYELFRANFIKPRQLKLVGTAITSKELFLAAVLEKPSEDLRAGHKWHIGNVELFSDYSGYFALGRTTQATIEKFDEASGNFVEEEQETSPYTHCIFDATLGILAIARKTALAQTTNAIAKRLEQILLGTKILGQHDVSAEIRPIPNPNSFLDALSTAYVVTRFTATFHGPNPVDADEYFQKPLSVYLAIANGTKGKTEIAGDDLNRQTLLEVTRSTASTGNQASARLKRTRSQRPITLRLSGNPIKKSYEETQHNPLSVLRDMTETYERVRTDAGNNSSVGRGTSKVPERTPK